MKKVHIFSIFAALALLTASCSENGVIPSDNNIPNLHADDTGGQTGHTPTPPPPPPPPPNGCLTCP